MELFAGWLSTQQEPWGATWNTGTWVFDTATEAHYPHLLAQRAVECIVQFLVSKGFSVDKPLRLHDRSTTVQGQQSKKHKPLVPEYHHVVSVNTGDPIPAGSKQSPPHFQGVRSEEEDDKREGTPLTPFSKFEIYHTPNSFCPWLRECGVPWTKVWNLPHPKTVFAHGSESVASHGLGRPPGGCYTVCFGFYF